MNIIKIKAVVNPNTTNSANTTNTTNPVTIPENIIEPKQSAIFTIAHILHDYLDSPILICNSSADSNYYMCVDTVRDLERVIYMVPLTVKEMTLLLYCSIANDYEQTDENLIELMNLIVKAHNENKIEVFWDKDWECFIEVVDDYDDDYEDDEDEDEDDDCYECDEDDD